MKSKQVPTTRESFTQNRQQKKTITIQRKEVLSKLWQTQTLPAISWNNRENGREFWAENTAHASCQII